MYLTPFSLTSGLLRTKWQGIHLEKRVITLIPLFTLNTWTHLNQKRCIVIPLTLYDHLMKRTSTWHQELTSNLVTLGVEETVYVDLEGSVTRLPTKTKTIKGELERILYSHLISTLSAEHWWPVCLTLILIELFSLQPGLY